MSDKEKLSTESTEVEVRVQQAETPTGGTGFQGLTEAEEKRYMASQWKLMWIKFRKHRLATVGVVVLAILYFGAIFCEFISPYEARTRYVDFMYAPPQKIHFVDEEGNFSLRPFVYGLTGEYSMETFKYEYVEDKTRKLPIHLFVKGDPYKMWGLFEWDVHLFGIKAGEPEEGEMPATFFLIGSDRMGRDLFSRIIYGSRISLSVGLIGIAISFVIGLLMGGVSGYFGGAADNIIQRVIETLRCIPTLPLWMTLSAALPPTWSPLKVYFGITVVLSFQGWTGLARVIRGQILSLREQDFTMAAQLSGAKPLSIIREHLLPSCFSYILVSLSLSIPAMILGETGLSFLGLGLRPPTVSWGVLLQSSQNMRDVAYNPWLMVPVAYVIVTVLAFNFLGDGLRDAADPYK
jgi:peptide/nickel transport system permease protein